MDEDEGYRSPLAAGVGLLGCVAACVLSWVLVVALVWLALTAWR